MSLENGPIDIVDVCWHRTSKSLISPAVVGSEHHTGLMGAGQDETIITDRFPNEAITDRAQIGGHHPPK